MKYFIIFFISVSTMVSKYETQKYSVILSDDDFEIRFYDSSIKAKLVRIEVPTEIFINFFSLLVEIIQLVKKSQ